MILKLKRSSNFRDDVIACLATPMLYQGSKIEGRLKECLYGQANIEIERIVFSLPNLVSSSNDSVWNHMYEVVILLAV
jgi:hypothetical protein